MIKFNSNIGQFLFLIIIFLFTSKFLQSTPFEESFFKLQAVFLVGLLFFLIIYYVSNFLKLNIYNKNTLYFSFLILIIPIFSAINSNIQFGQPILYGILSQRNWLLLGVGILIFYQISNYKLSIRTTESSLIFMAWLSLIFFTLIVLFFDPSQLDESSKFAINDKERGIRYKFQNFFITFGTLYYFIRYDITKNKINLLILIIFLLYILLVIQGRTYMLFLAITIYLYYLFNYPLTKVIIKTFNIFIFLILCILLISFFSPGYVDKMIDLFSQMFTVLTGEMSNDNSSNARIWTSLTVLNYFEHNAYSSLFGTGRISNQWNGGYERLFGYFYPEDIGLLGGTFLYGIFGMVFLLIIPYFWIYKEIRKTKSNDVFILTLKFMLILSIIRIPQGGLYFGPNMWIVLFLILYAHNQIQGRTHAE